MGRMRWRHGDATQSPALSPDQVYEVEIDLMAVAYIFPKGHSIRVAVSSAAAPFYNANSNTGRFGLVDQDDVPVVARNAIHTGPQHPSSILLPVVDMHAIPPNPDFA